MRKVQLMKMSGIVLSVIALALVGFSAVAAQGTTATVTPGYLGVRFVAADSGVLVVEVVADSPAAAAGLKVGDLLLAVNGEPVAADNVRDAIQSHAAGDTLTLGIERRGEPMDVDATLAEAPVATMPQFPFNQSGMTTERPYLGIGINTADDGGIVIGLVQDESPAAAAGLQVDDRITQVNGVAVTTAQEVVAAVQALQVGDTVTVTVDRAGETLDIEATLAATPVMMPFDRSFGRGGMMLNDGQIGLSWSEGKLQITDLSEDHPLYAAGLRAGDAITAINDQPLTDVTALFGVFEGMNGDGTITLTLDRAGETMTLDVQASTLLEGFHFFGMPGGTDMPGFFGRGFHGFADPSAESTPEPNA